MKFRYTYMFLAGLLPLGIAGCASSRTETRKVSVNQINVLTPDSNSWVEVDVMLHIPERTFSKRSRLVVVPQLVRQDSMLAECEPLVLDAPVYAKKMERKKKLEGYVDTLSATAQPVSHRQSYDIPYRTKVQVPATIDNARILAVLSSDGCGDCDVVDTVEMAQVANFPTLVEPKKAMQLNWIEPEYVIRPKIMQAKGEASLQFLIDRHDINLGLGKNEEEMSRMLTSLQSIVNDTLATLNSIAIFGKASADGSYYYNVNLAKRRAASAKNWLLQHLGKEESQLPKDFSVGARPEGWLPVLEAMIADGHPDTLQVKEILYKYNDENDDVAERHIRRLPCWGDIKKNYLQNDRKVEYVYNYTLRSFTTDAELLDMYDKRPDAFSEGELLRVSTLKQTPEEKKGVYRTLLHYFPQSAVAANNLAVLYLREDKVEEAEKVLDSIKEYSPEMLNTKAALYIYRSEYEKAVELLDTRQDLPEARYNLALIKAEERKLDEAFALMEGYEDTNVAIIALSLGHIGQADEIMKACQDDTPLAYYVRALVAARQGDCEEACGYLEKAVADEGLKRRMETEPYFTACRTLPQYQLLLKGGKVDE